MALATLSIDLTAKIAQFEKDLGRAATVAEQNAERIRATFLRIGSFATGLLGGVTAGALVTMVKAQVDAIDGFNDLKDATGASIENISALDSLARRTGVTFDTVGTSLIKFNAALKEGDKAGVFKAIGLDVEKLKSLDPAEALRQTAVALAGFADDGNKARAVQELFGKSLREVAPLLKDLGEEGTLVAKTTTAEAEAAEKFNKELFKMSASITDISRDMAGPMVSALNQIIEKFRDGAKDGESFYTTLLRVGSWMPGPGGLPGKLLNAYDQFKGQPNGYTQAREDVDRLSGFVANSGPGYGNIYYSNAQKRADLAAAQQRLGGFLNSNAGGGRGMGGYGDVAKVSLELPPDKPTATGAKGPDLAAQGAKLALSLTAQDAGLSGDFLEKWDKLSAAYKANDISLSMLTSAQSILLKQQPFMKEAVYSGDVSDALSRRLDATERARKETEQLNAELDQLSGRTGADKKRDLTAALEQRLNAGEVFSKEELDRIVNGIGGITSATDEAAKATVNYADVFESRFESAIVKGGKLKDVLKGLAQDLATLYLRENVTKPLAKAASGGFESLLKSISGGGGSGFDFAAAGAMDSYLGFANGGVMTSRGAVPLRAYANGGVATSPQLAMFGEGSKAEAYVPLPDGRRIPVAMKGGGGAPITIVNQLTVGDVASSAMVQDQLRASEARMAASLQRAQRYGRG